MIEQAYFNYKGNQYHVDMEKPLDISIPLSPGTHNPNCYYTDPVVIEPVRTKEFVGSVAEGGSCNHRRISLAPHGNGTHTECYGHISADPEATLSRCLKHFHFLAQVISVSPESHKDDQVVRTHQIIPRLDAKGPQALIIRTLPNGVDKLTRQYSGSNPPYLDPSLVQDLTAAGIEHLLVDLPSIDREVDRGKLSAHRTFWGFPDKIRRHCTITELVYVADVIPDGLYLLNLQVTSLEIDASPSKPVLYPFL